MEEKETRVLTVILLSISTIVIISFLFFFFAVAKVDAEELSCQFRYTYGSDIVSNSNNATTFGSGIVLNQQLTGHYADLNNIQNEAICTGNFISGNKYHIVLQAQPRIRGQISSNDGLMYRWTWQKQIRNNATNTEINNEGYTTDLVQAVMENGDQAMVIQVQVDIIPTTNISQIKFGFKTTKSLTSYNTLQMIGYKVTSNRISSENEDIVDAINQGVNNNNLHRRTETDRIIDNQSNVANQVTNAINGLKSMLEYNGNEGNIPNPDVSSISNQQQAEARAKQNAMSQQDMEDILSDNGINMISNATKQDASDFINDSWELITDNYKVFTMIVILLTLGFMKLILDR